MATRAAANDAYTGMLIISLGAMLLGTVLLALNYFSYGDTKPSEVPKYSPPAKKVEGGGGQQR